MQLRSAVTLPFSLVGVIRSMRLVPWRFELKLLIFNKVRGLFTRLARDLWLRMSIIT